MKGQVWKSLLGIVTSFIGSVLVLYAVSYYALSFIESSDGVSYPSSLAEIQTLVSSLRGHLEIHFSRLLLVFCLSFLFKQAFAIPGSALLNVFAGALFGLPTGFPLVCVLTACGATCCFLLSKYFGRPILETYFPHRLSSMEQSVHSNQHRLFFFLVSLRLFPMTPNWMINVVSPLAGVPISQFFVSVLIGLAPYNFLCVQGGLIVSQLQAVSDLFSLRIVIMLASMALVSTLPAMLISKPSSNEADQCTKPKSS
eukprot:scpid78651/ scgid19770/ Transmembrane protein 41A